MTPKANQVPIGPRLANRQRVRAALLDSAEELFADCGYFGVSIRDITDRAGTRVAAVSDIFGGKENLIREVLRRRAVPINEDRLYRLGFVCRASSKVEAVQTLVHAFAGPLLDRADGGPGWRHYFAFIAQLANSGRTVKLLLVDEYSSVATEFVDKIAELSPGARDGAAHDAYMLMVASTLHVFADTMRLDGITNGWLRSSDFEYRYSALVVFLVGGIARLTDKSVGELSMRQ